MLITTFAEAMHNMEDQSHRNSFCSVTAHEAGVSPGADGGRYARRCTARGGRRFKPSPAELGSVGPR